MEFDPHTLHNILIRIKQQMRCPQCGEKVPVDFASVRLTGNDFMLLQIRCEACDAYIVLHASLQGAKKDEPAEKGSVMNASSSLCLEENEIEILHEALKKSGGNLQKLFDEGKRDVA